MSGGVFVVIHCIHDSSLMLCSILSFMNFHSVSFFSECSSSKYVVRRGYESGDIRRWNAVFRGMGFLIGDFWVIWVGTWRLRGRFCWMLVSGFWEVRNFWGLWTWWSMIFSQFLNTDRFWSNWQRKITQRQTC